MITATTENGKREVRFEYTNRGGDRFCYRGVVRPHLGLGVGDLEHRENSDYCNIGHATGRSFREGNFFDVTTRDNGELAVSSPRDLSKGKVYVRMGDEKTYKFTPVPTNLSSLTVRDGGAVKVVPWKSISNDGNSLLDGAKEDTHVFNFVQEGN